MDKHQTVVCERCVDSSKLFNLLDKYIGYGCIIKSITRVSKFHGLEQEEADYIVILEQES